MDIKAIEAKYTAEHMSEFVKNVKKMEVEKDVFKVGKHSGSYGELVDEYSAKPHTFTREDCLGMLQLARYNGDIPMSGVFSSAAFDREPMPTLG